MSSIATSCHRDRARDMWRWCLASAFRTALACTVVGCITLYGPPALNRQVAFPAFSYVAVILIVTDATLGDTVRGCWLALYATAQSIGPAMLSLYLIGPSNFSSGTISVAVALAAFVVTLPQGTHLIAKRIALGQIVIVYVIAFINGVHTQPIMHPLHVAASTALGVSASVVALLLPFPRLASLEVKRNCKNLAENTSERVKLYVKAFCAQEKSLALAYISQVRPLSLSASKLLSTIKRHQESVKWETIPLKFLRSYCVNSAERLQELEMPLRGMELAFTSNSLVPTRILEEASKKSLYEYLEEHVTITIKQIKSCLSCDDLSLPESNAENITKLFRSLEASSLNSQDLPSLFFLFCIKLIRSKSLSKHPAATPVSKDTLLTNDHDQNEMLFKRITSNNFVISKKRLIPAAKCSLSLGLAVLFGLTYSKENGYWSGLPVAISLASAREATFKVANVKGQGTVLGTVYGVIGCFIFERFIPIRFLSLLPWFIITSFLRSSKMYGQAGGISAVIGAVLILGRKNFGPPSEFAIARIIETFIGLSCSILVELLLHPTRAASLAKVQLSESFQVLHDCIGSISCLEGNTSSKLLESQKRLKLEVSELAKLVGEAEVEPNFWYTPFHSVCYAKLLGSLSKMVDLFFFSTQAIGFLEQEYSLQSSSYREASCKEQVYSWVHELESDLAAFKEMVGSSIKFFEAITQLRSLADLEKEPVNRNLSLDVEMGKSSRPNLFFSVSGTRKDENKGSNIMNSYLQHCKEIVEKSRPLDLDFDLDHDHDHEEDCNEDVMIIKSQMILNLSALGFCISNLIKETREIEKGITDLLQWENPSSDINLYHLSCQIQALYN